MPKRDNFDEEFPSYNPEYNPDDVSEYDEFPGTDARGRPQREHTFGETAADVGRSVVSAPAKGAIGLASMPNAVLGTIPKAIQHYAGIPTGDWYDKAVNTETYGFADPLAKVANWLWNRGGGYQPKTTAGAIAGGTAEVLSSGMPIAGGIRSLAKSSLRTPATTVSRGKDGRGAFAKGGESVDGEAYMQHNPNLSVPNLFNAQGKVVSTSPNAPALRQAATEIVTDPKTHYISEALPSGLAGATVGYAADQGATPEQQAKLGMIAGMSPIAASAILPKTAYVQAGRRLAESVAGSVPPNAVEKAKKIPLVGPKIEKFAQGAHGKANDEATSQSARILQDNIHDIDPEQEAEFQRILEVLDPDGTDQRVKFTLGEQTKSQSLLETQADIGPLLSSDKQADEITRRRATTEAIKDRLDEERPVPTSPDTENPSESVAKRSRARINNARRWLANKIDDNEAAQHKQAADLKAESRDRQELGADIRERLLADESNARLEGQKRAEEVGLNNPNTKIPVKRMMRRIVEAYRAAAKLKFAGGDAAFNENSILSKLKKFGDNMTLGEIQNLRSRIGKELNNARSSKSNDSIPDQEGLPAAIKAIDTFIDEIAGEVPVGPLQDMTKAPGFETDVAAIQGMAAGVREAKQNTTKIRGLVQWIKERGGMQNTGKDGSGDLKDILGSSKSRAGFWNDKTGESWDDVALAATEEGFFTSRPSKQEFFDAIDDDFRAETNQGGRRRVRHADQAALDDLNETIRMEDDLSEIGVDLKIAKTDDDVRRLYTEFVNSQGHQRVLDADVANQLRDWRKWYKENVFDKFEEGAVKRATQHGERTSDHDLARVFWNHKKPEALDQYLSIAGGETPEIRAAALGDLYDNALDGGIVKQSKFDDWKRRNSALLKKTPELAAEVETFGQAVKAMGDRAESLIKKRKAVNGSLLGRAIEKVYGDIDPAHASWTPEQMIDDVIKHPVKMREAMRAMPESQKETFATAIWDRVLRDGDQKALDFIKKNHKTLELALGKKKLNTLRDLLLAMERINLVPAPTAKNIRKHFEPQAIKAAEEGLNMGLNQLSSRIFAAQSGRTSWRWIMTDIGGRMIRGYSQGRAADLLVEAMINPDLAKAMQSAFRLKIDPAKRYRAYTFLAASGFQGDLKAKTDEGHSSEFEDDPSKQDWRYVTEEDLKDL
jgi:hypothetical protein